MSSCFFQKTQGFKGYFESFTAERCAVGVYTDICNMTLGKDPRTYDLSLAILHEAWFQEPLEGRPSGHFRRRKPGEGL